MNWAWVSYRKKVFEKVATYRAKSEHPVMIPNVQKRTSGIIVCASMLPYYTPYIGEWLEYQKVIGVDHVHMILESTFLNRGSFEVERLQDAVEEGFVSVNFWHQWLNETDICDHSLDLARYTCALQFKDSYSYVIFSDPREFFIPQSWYLAEALSRSCSNTHCHFQLRNMFYESCRNVKVGQDGNVTAAVSPTKLEWGSEGLIVYRSSKLTFMKGEMAFSTKGVADVPVEKSYIIRLVKSKSKSSSAANYKRLLPETEKC